MSEQDARRRYERAVALHRQGRLAEAEAHYAKLREAFPDHPGVLHGLGLIWLSGPRVTDAVSVLERAARLAPQDAAIRSDLGRALLLSGRYEEAAACFRFARTRRPDDAGVLIGLGESLSVLGDSDGAREAFEAALQRWPDLAAAHYGLGNLDAQLGRRAGARAAFERAIALAPERGAYHRALADLQSFADGDPRLDAMTAAVPRATARADAAEFHFALGKAYDDLKRFDEAFAHFARANAIQRELIDYDEAAVARSFDALRATFTPALFEKLRGGGYASDQPVLVVGMPRSGTSLVEQILAAHPRVHGAGELQTVGSLIGRGLPGYPATMGAMPADMIEGIGRAYAQHVASLAPKAARIVDKLPANFRHLGLIQLALPDAKIIHVRRDAMDTCWSCYTKLFPPGMNFAYEQDELGRYYKMYDALMAHWRAVLPADALLEVSYETLLDELESEARRMIAFIGLGWDERCLRFHESDRAVRTLSAGQVRQPLFKSSVGRWKPYARFLGPLMQALG